VLDLPLRRALLMGIKEALNNAVKYSGASELLLQIKCHGKKLVVAVQDNGKGLRFGNRQAGRRGSFKYRPTNEGAGGNTDVDHDASGKRMSHRIYANLEIRPTPAIILVVEAGANSGSNRPGQTGE